jgi:subtilisin family serine protease
VGDSTHPYLARVPTGVAAALDRIVYENDVVVVISAGNVSHEEHDGFEYVAEQVQRDERHIAPPGMAALALTAGALVPDGEQGARPARESVAIRQLGEPGWPSPVTRSGPGVEFAIKPELSAPGGTYVYDRDSKRVRPDRARGTVLGSSGGNPERVLMLDIGTSFAAPLVSHAALRVLSRYPQLTATGVRALLLSSARMVKTVLTADTGHKATVTQRYLSGFGRASADHAETSTEHRAVLLGEESIRQDEVHFYEVPVPQAFRMAGRRLDRQCRRRACPGRREERAGVAVMGLWDG